MDLGHKIYGKQIMKVKHNGRTRNLVVLARAKMVFAHSEVDKFNDEHGTKLRIVPLDLADSFVNAEDIWIGMDRFTFPVDCAIAYEEPGRKLRKYIKSPDHIYPKVVFATGKYKGERNIALVAHGLTSSDFKLEGETLRLDISDDRLLPVTQFPEEKEGWYIPDLETGIPHGKRILDLAILPKNTRQRANYPQNKREPIMHPKETIESTIKARFLVRMRQTSYAGLLTFSEFGPFLNANQPLAERGDYERVLAEVPDEDVDKIRPLLSEAKTDIKVSGILPSELRALLARFKQDLEGLGDIADNELLEAGKQIERVISGATKIKLDPYD